LRVGCLRYEPRTRCGCAKPDDVGMATTYPFVPHGERAGRTFVQRAHRNPASWEELSAVAYRTDTCSIDRTRDGVRVSGELDLQAAPALKEALVALVEEGHVDVVVDMTDATFLDSTALGVLAGRFRELRSRNGSLAVICNNPHVLETLEIAGVGHALTVCHTREELTLTPWTAA
jgi:anti-sigma B factor antagonist